LDEPPIILDHTEQSPYSVAMRLMERLDRACRLAHLARSTRLQYARWVEQYLRFHRHPDGSWRPPPELRGAEVAAFLTHMAVERRLSESSQNQALCAIVFLYEHVLEELPKDHLGEIRALRSMRPKTLPTVLSAAEIARLIDALPVDTDCGARQKGSGRLCLDPLNPMILPGARFSAIG
jgi:site-specific recombinase XerD